MKLARKLQQRKHPVRQSCNQNQADDGTGDKEDKEGKNEDKNSTGIASPGNCATDVASVAVSSGTQPGNSSTAPIHSPLTISCNSSGSLSGKENNNSGKDMRRLPQQGKEKCSPRVTLRIHQIKEKSTKVSKSGSNANDVESFVSAGMDGGKSTEENSGGGGGLKACDPGGEEDGHDSAPVTAANNEAPTTTGSGVGANASGSSTTSCGVDDESRSCHTAADNDSSTADNSTSVAGASSSSTSGAHPSEPTNDSGSAPASVKRSHSSDDDPAPEDGKKRRRKDDKGKTSGSTEGSPKSVPGCESEGEDAKSAKSPGPKVPPLKIVISGVSLEETGAGGRNGKNGSGRHHLPYVVSAPPDLADNATPAASAQQTGGSSLSNASSTGLSGGNGLGGSASLAGEDAEDRRSGSGEDATAPASSSGTGRGGHHQRVLRSHRGKKGSNKDSNSSGSGAPSPAGEGGSPRQVSPIPATEAGNEGDDKSTTVPGTSTASSATSCEPDKNSSPPPPPAAPQELHPRKRKIRARDNGGASGSNSVNSGASSSAGPSGGGGGSSNTGNNSGSESGSSSEPGSLGGSGATLPSSTAQDSITNSYQLFLNIRKQIERKRKGLFPVQPKPPRGFKDYLMNRCTYVLANNASNRVPPPSNKPPADLHQGLKELYLNQEKERHRLLTQHVIEKEKLVLSVEQEILRVHGRAARALANQALPFSACTILRDEEVYSAITPEQEEKDRNARVRFNGRLFLSWLQDVDDKWEKIKESMLLRHHNEADSLHAVQKMDWEWKMKELAICDFKASPVIDDTQVPTVHVSDDFDLLPA